MPVRDKVAPPQGGREADAGSQMGERKTGTSEGEGAEGMLPWDILKGLFLGDTCNGLTNFSRLYMLWTFFHRWPGGAHLDLNCYRNSAKLLVCCQGEVELEALLSKEGVKQGDALFMVLYVLILSVMVEQISGSITYLSSHGMTMTSARKVQETISNLQLTTLRH